MTFQEKKQEEEDGKERKTILVKLKGEKKLWYKDRSGTLSESEIKISLAVESKSEGHSFDFLAIDDAVCLHVHPKFTFAKGLRLRVIIHLKVADDVMALPEKKQEKKFLMRISSFFCEKSSDSNSSWDNNVFIGESGESKLLLPEISWFGFIRNLLKTFLGKRVRQPTFCLVLTNFSRNDWDGIQGRFGNVCLKWHRKIKLKIKRGEIDGNGS